MRQVQRYHLAKYLSIIRSQRPKLVARWLLSTYRGRRETDEQQDGLGTLHGGRRVCYTPCRHLTSTDPLTDDTRLTNPPLSVPVFTHGSRPDGHRFCLSRLLVRGLPSKHSLLREHRMCPRQPLTMDLPPLPSPSAPMPTIGPLSVCTLWPLCTFLLIFIFRAYHTFYSPNTLQHSCRWILL